jgi:predicted short-subunit dehydrogenase-like oxidoreductase (DUF2520 family)
MARPIAIIGTGRLGTSLGRALARKGYGIAWLADRNPAAARTSRRIVRRGKATADVAKAADKASVIFLCVPDEEIPRLALRLARSIKDVKGKFFFQTSGILSSQALAALRARGAACASFHPVQSFARNDSPPRRYQKIFIGLEGDSLALKLAKKIAIRLGARTLRVRPEDKIFYHAACSLASNLFVPLFNEACLLLEHIGFGTRAATRILYPLVEGTLQNVKLFDRTAALTGPLSRGDVETVRLHLRALRPHPAAREIYRALGIRALTMARKKRVPAARIRRLRELLERK